MNHNSGHVHIAGAECGKIISRSVNMFTRLTGRETFQPIISSTDATGMAHNGHITCILEKVP